MKCGHGAGLGTNSETNWAGILTILGEKFHVLAPDLIGYGNTDIPENIDLTHWEWTTARIRQVLELMDHNNIQKAHLVGNSMDGVISFSAAIYAPDRFNKIITMGSAGGELKELTPELVRATNFDKDPTVQNLKNILISFMYDESIIINILDNIEDRYEKVMRKEVREIFPKLFAQSPTEYMFSPSNLMRIKQKVLLIHGYEDRLVPKESSLTLLEHIPNAQLVLLKQCGHWAQIEQKDRFIQLVEQFLSVKETADSLK
ncbi:alpha/beta fold hydrolase [Peribacillus sp. NPDC096379]|uniref:alpha/beta fold hydrolase n=1 Tax=Peribacillus sp. NPDC096379 TaxID=3364393 RepID=UPI0038084481